MKKNILFLALVAAAFFSSSCQAQNDQAISQVKFAESLCDEVQHLEKDKKLRNIIITQQNTNSQYIDINNDGVNEELRYFPTRTFLALGEIHNKKKLILPVGTPNAEYSGADVVDIGNRNYVLNYVLGDAYELIEIEHNKKFLKSGEPNKENPYQANIVCKFYQ